MHTFRIYLLMVLLITVVLGAKTFWTMEEIIASSGFPVETHNVTTKDGFILSPVRIPAASTCNQTRVIAFLSGITTSGHVFVMNKPTNFSKSLNFSNLCSEKFDESKRMDNRLPFELAPRCFDVWLLANRGTEKGLKHISYKMQEKRFWAWSLDEIVKFDLPASINYIRLKTHKDKLSLIGHSVGGTLALLLATNPDYQQYLDALILLAPVVPETNVFFERKHRMLASAAAIFRNFDGPLVPQPLIYNAWKYMCDKPLKLIFLRPFMSKTKAQYEPNFDCDSVHYLQSSVRTFIHASQISTTERKRFLKYDFGLWKNIVIYGKTKPPEYNIGRIVSENIVIFYGSDDVLVSQAAIFNLVGLLKVKPKQVSSVAKFNHVDFIFGKEVGQLFNYKVLQAFQNIYC